MEVGEVARWLEQRRIHTIKVGGADLEGVYRGKRMAAPQFVRGLADGFPQCDCIFGWDIAENLIDGLDFTGWHTGFPDLEMIPDLSTLAETPWEPGVASVVVDFALPDGTPACVSPRTVLKQTVKRLGDLGLRPRSALELEFRLYRETPQTLEQKGYSNLSPISPTTSCYSIYRASTDEFYLGNLRRYLDAYGIPIEGYNREHGPGMYEVNLRYNEALTAADQALLYKTAAKEIAAHEGLIASFMAKPVAGEDGMSGHTHISLWDMAGEHNLMAGDHGLSELGGQFLAGVIATLPELMALYAPTINSYKRYVAGTWAPLNATWASENRTGACRTIAPRHKPEATRIELRVPGADVNPYLAIAGVLAGGMYGIAHHLTPPPALQGNAYDLAPDLASPLPRSLSAAAAALKQSTVAREAFGDGFVDHFVRTREWEVQEFQREVTAWERRRYLEMV